MLWKSLTDNFVVFSLCTAVRVQRGIGYFGRCWCDKVSQRPIRKEG